MKIDPDAPAMPFSVDVPEIHHLEGGHTTPAYTHMNPGLTIRAHFAATILSGWVANAFGLSVTAGSGKSEAEIVKSYAEDAVKYADALVEALNK